jgi:hypothetical protein
MLYVATVHFMSDRWVPIQLRYLQRYVQAPYEVYSYADPGYGRGLEDSGPVYRKPVKAGSAAENHAVKLDFLAAEIVKRAKPDDTIVFLDGDAFPIRTDFAACAEAWSKRPGLAAIQRREGPSPLTPHPSFCAVSVRMWKELPGSWNPAACKVNGAIIQDTGSRLYKRLTAKRQPWHPIRRTNKINLHHLYCGVYGDLIYHHGAAFRPSCLPGWKSTGVNNQSRFQTSEKVLKLIERHEDFFELFRSGKYRDQV